MSIVLSQMKFDKGRLSCEVESAGGNVPKQLYFDVGEDRYDMVNASYDALLISIIPLAMYLGENIEVKGNIDSDLYENILEAIALFNAWYPKKTSIIDINATELVVRSTLRTGKTMSFYSGGVDSLFNIAGRVADGIGAVEGGVLVRGMDIPIEETELWDKVSTSLSESIHSFGADMVVVETNARAFQPKGVDWTSTGFGPLLGAVCNLLSRGYDKALIGSYGRYRDLAPHASGPLIDRLWSSGGVDVVHYSPRFNRLDKIKVIKEYTPALLSTLRVCWKNPSGKYNCGICEKCLRTKSELYIAGAESLVSSFGKYDLKRDLKSLSGNIPVDKYTHRFWVDIAKELPKRGMSSIVIYRALFRYYIFLIPNILYLLIKDFIKRIVER